MRGLSTFHFYCIRVMEIRKVFRFLTRVIQSNDNLSYSSGCMLIWLGHIPFILSMGGLYGVLVRGVKSGCRRSVINSTSSSLFLYQVCPRVTLQLATNLTSISGNFLEYGSYVLFRARSAIHLRFSLYVHFRVSVACDRIYTES